jgi:hypothetical protein
MSESTIPRGSGCGCASFRPGHNAHSIQAHQANSDPSSWFDGFVIQVVDEDASVRYHDGTVCKLWRHAGFGGRIEIGDRVVVCEAWSLLALRGDGVGTQLSVQVTSKSWRGDGLPEDRPYVERTGIVNNESGEGLDLYHHDNI